MEFKSSKNKGRGVWSKKQKLHILIVSQYFYPENFRINDIATEWVKRGYKVTVVTGIPNYPIGKFFDGYGYIHRRKEQWNGIDIIRIPLIPRGNCSIGMIMNYISFAVSGFFWKQFSCIKADLVFTFEVSPMTQALIGVWYAKKHHIPHFLYVQDLWPENVEVVAGVHNPIILKPINYMVDYIYKNADKIFTTSPSFAKAIEGRKVLVNSNKIHYWPQYAEEFYNVKDRGVARENLKQKSIKCLIQNDDCFKVVFTGNIGTAQGLDVLPKVAKLLLDRKIHFVIVGDGRYQKKFESEIERYEVKERFTLISRQPAEIIPELLALCDVAFLSFIDTDLFAKTIPAKLQSYMACGMVVLAAAKGETERVIKEAQCGVCVSIGDAQACADAIKVLMKTDLAVMKRNSRNYALTHFNKRKLMDEMDVFIKNELK
ncbi:MAG: glycosyltransferase family 4 protein [Lachnospiraceae bacterium]|nr:glycosyltransferase family 4 protein [Lachnospiraceae bacterium]